MKLITGFVMFICLLFSFSGGAETVVHPSAPIEYPILLNYKGTPGIYVKLRMETGKELVFMIDTGRPHTSFDKSLEPFLGKRVGRAPFFEPLVDGITLADMYKAPKLYLGDTPLLTSSRICAYDWQRWDPGVMGVLGIDCLRHYCVQFDFAHKKIRFLDPDHINPSDLGTSVPLTIIFGLVIARANCFGAGNMYFCPDTGNWAYDATIKPSLFRRKLRQQKPIWTDNIRFPNGASSQLAGFTNAIFAGKTYTHLAIDRWYSPWPDGDLIGLPFLARHLVTFNFPKRMMYLKQETSAPRFQDYFPLEEAEHYIQDLADKGGLPGLTTNDCAGGTLPDLPDPIKFPITLTLTLKKSPVPHWIDLTPRIQTLVANGARVIRVDNAMAGCDPAHGYPKELRIDYSVGKLRRMALAMEGQTVTLPAGAQIIRAHYGYPYGSRLDPSHLDPLIDDSQYHYTLIQKSMDSPWQLQKAWRTDKAGHVVEQYHLEKQNYDSIGAR